jgi:hypothetical protein
MDEKKVTQVVNQAMQPFFVRVFRKLFTAGLALAIAKFGIDSQWTEEQVAGAALIGGTVASYATSWAVDYLWQRYFAKKQPPADPLADSVKQIVERLHKQ